MDRCRLLYLESYTAPDPKSGAPSSDAIGYSITASAAIRRQLELLSFEVVRPAPSPSGRARDARTRRLSWILSNYTSVLDVLAEDPPNAIFVFHVFSTFPAEIRRIVLDLGLAMPIVGYTHGSHWAPTDRFRFVAYPGMEMVDLANLDVLDCILLVSEYMRATLRDNVGAFNKALADRLDSRVAVVGLPLDVERIDACRAEQPFPRTTVVFNHAQVSSKNPDLFVRVMARVLPRFDVNVLFTRDFTASQPGGAAVAELAERFPDQVILGHDMPLDDYYRSLWAADIQVSTATHESLGVSTLEAMYTGNCCILPRLGSYPEICQGHPDVLYELGEGPLEERLCYFLEHPERRRQVAAELQRMTVPYHPSAVVARIARAVLDLVD